MPAVTGFESTNVAAGFDGLRGSVQVPGLELETDTFTMVCWLKRDGTQPARGRHHAQPQSDSARGESDGAGVPGRRPGVELHWEDLADTYNSTGLRAAGPDLDVLRGHRGPD